MKPNKTWPLAIAIAASVCSAGHAATFVYTEDYEGASPYNLNNGNGQVAVTAPVADPHASGSHGMVAAIDHSLNDGTWGEVRASPAQSFELGPGAIGMAFTLKVDYYVPSSSRFTGTDGLSVLTRFHDGTDAGYRSISTGASLGNATRDVWHTITLNGIIPATDGDGNGVTHVMPFISFADHDPDIIIGQPGIDAYFDNFSFTYSYIPTPAALPMGLGLMAMLAARRRR